MALALVGAGLGCAALALAAQFRPNSPSHTVFGRPSADEAPPEPTDPLVAIDEWIQAGSFAKAAPLCQALIERGDPANCAAAQYRLGLCQEAVGELHEALGTFEQLAAGTTATELSRAGQFGQARCWLRTGHTTEARAMLAQLDRLSAPAPGNKSAWRGELAYWHAALEKTEFTSEHPPPSALARLPISADLRMSAERYLTLVRRSSNAAHGSTSEPDEAPTVTDSADELGNSQASPAAVATTDLPPAARLRAACEKALADAPDHPLAPAATLEIANLYANEGHWVEAGRRYEQLLKTSSNESIVRLGEYNLGLAHLNSYDFPAAREVFQTVIDRSAADELAGLAWWWIARTFLDSGDGDRALKPLRAAAANRAPEVQAAASLGLCAARLLRQNATEAHTALRAGPRKILRSPPFGDEAAFLDSYARWRLARNGPAKAKDQAEELLWSLQHEPRESVLGPVGLFLRAVALQNLGLQAEMARFCDRAVPICKGPLTTQLVEMCAEYQFRTRDFAAARQRYLSLGTSSDPTVAVRARLRLAEIALHFGHPNESLTLCRAVITESNPLPEMTVQIMGRAYEALGDRSRAADCFGGRVPKD